MLNPSYEGSGFFQSGIERQTIPIIEARLASIYMPTALPKSIEISSCGGNPGNHWAVKKTVNRPKQKVDTKKNES
jgi:hypothetical protein